MRQRLVYDKISKEEIVNEYSKGLSERVIAKKFNVCRKIIRDVLKSKNIIIRPKIIYPSFEIINQKYMIEKKSIRQISKELNMCYSAVNNLLIKYKLKTKFNANLVPITKEIIQDYNNGLSSCMIAKKYKVSKAGVLKILRKNNIKIRLTKKRFDKGLLQHKYLNEKKSIRDIVKETKSHEATIRRNLKEIGIIPRKFNEQQSIDNDNGKNISLNKIKGGIEKDPRFFYLLGAFKGDGHYNVKQTKIQFSVTDFDFIEEVKRTFNTLSPETRMNIIDHTPATERNKKQWRINICCRGFFHRGYHNLLPKTLQEKRFYLKGLFDAEGSISTKSSITIVQKNINDLKLWKEWLEELGIQTTMSLGSGKISKNIYHTEKPSTYIRHGKIIERTWKEGRVWYSKNDSGSLRIIGEDSKINFSDAIGFKIKRKKDRLESYIKKIKPLPIYNISNELITQDMNKIKGVKVKSIKFSHREQGVDLSVNYKYHNFILDNGMAVINSTCAQQVAYYVAWLLAGGKMDQDAVSKKWRIKKNPEKKVHFNLEDNIVFSPEGLMKKASELYKKYGRNQVIIYDEGRAGLDSASAMQAINKAMQDFFQECGMYGHVIIIVLPNFFKLHEDYAVNRSLFLIDVYADKSLRRGFFNFYNETQKEWLFYMGKKKIGSTLKYSDSRPSFSGRFTQFLPLDKDKYEAAKREALKQKELRNTEKKWKKQRDAALYLLREQAEMNSEDIAKQMTVVCGFQISADMVRHGIEAITHKKEKEE